MSDPSSGTHDDLLESLLGDFLDESDQLLTQLNEDLLHLDEWARALDLDHEEQCDGDLLNNMFRAAHSLKGLSAMLGLNDINNLTHKIENVFDAARRNELTVNRDVTELIFLGLDQLVALVDLLKVPDGEPVECDAVLDAIHRLLQNAGVAKAQASQQDADLAMRDGLADCDKSPPAEAQADDAENQSDPFDGLQDEDQIPDKYLSVFVDETDGSLDGLTTLLLNSESGGSQHDLQDMLCTVHRIKGSAASIGLNRPAKLAHLMEDLFEDLLESSPRQGAVLSGDMIDVLLKCTDGLRQYLCGLREGKRQPDNFGALARELRDAQQPRNDASEKSAAHVGVVQFSSDCPTPELKAHLIYEKLAKAGSVCWCDPAIEQLDAIQGLTTFRFQLVSDWTAESIANCARLAGVLQVTVRPAGEAAAEQDETICAQDRRSDSGPMSAVGVSAPTAGAKTKPAIDEGMPAAESPACKGRQSSARARPPSSESSQRPAETVRVDIDRLDQLMDLAGQLVINKAHFSQIAEKLRNVLACKQSASALGRVSADLEKMSSEEWLRLDGSHASSAMETVRTQIRKVQTNVELIRREIETMRDARDSVRDLFEAIHQLDRVTDGIQQGVMETRMVPIGPLFARFKRVVRDITRSNNKQVCLEIHGEKTELDKRMIDALGDPLVHMVRNSADHGIEMPEVREAAGKPRQGTITLDAFHRGNSIVIEVRDDGKGLDTERIRQKCLDKGILGNADAEKMTDRQIHQMIWEPGLSTAEKVTEVSGRGMGMDIVKSKIESLSGTIEIESVAGKGTTIIVKLPLTLAILPSLMVEINNDVFALPMEDVSEIVSVGPEQLSTVHGRQMATVRQRVVSMVRIGDVLGFHRAPTGADIDSSRETTLVIVGEAGREVGLAVDRVIGEEDVVIKSIAENYRNVPGIAGASILGDGRVSLILDVATLVEMVSKKEACLAHQEQNR